MAAARGSGGDQVLDVATPNQGGGDAADEADLAVFVDRLAAAGTDQATKDAQTQIRRAIAAGAAPPGVRRLAEALAASVAELPPRPRHPSEGPGAVVSAVRDNNLVILEDFDAPSSADAIGALLADGRRVIVTAEQPAELAAVRDILPEHVAARALDALPELPPAELRELRRLLATSTPERKARAGQALPPANALPAADEVAQLCRQVDDAKQPDGSETGAWMLPTLLADLDETRRSAVTSVARCVRRSLGDLRPREEHEWAWQLISELIYGRRQATFDRLLEDSVDVLAGLERTRANPPVTFSGALPQDAVEILRRYHGFLSGGGRSRTYFRSGPQREAQPVLDLVQVGSRRPTTAEDVQIVIEHLELAERKAQIDAGCVQLGIPVPRDEGEFVETTDRLGKAAAAARWVSALRHDVLFVAHDSPVFVPDVEAAEEIAEVILDYADNGSGLQAARRLDAVADALAGLTPAAVMAPEHERAVAALRAHDAAGYAEAVEAIDAARREARDESLQAALLRRLNATAPGLAQAWTELASSEPNALGLAVFLPATSLLRALPPPDSADVVVVLGAVGVERLLLTAVAPRLIAVVGPGERRDDATTLLSVLRRASALVIPGRGRKGGRVVPLASAAQRTTRAAVS